MKAYVLINIMPGSIDEVVENLRRLEGVSQATMTFGPYDAVAVLDAKDVRAIGRIVCSGIQPIPGIVETMTCLAVDET